MPPTLSFTILCLFCAMPSILAIPKPNDDLHFNLREPPGRFTSLQDVDFARGKFALYSEQSTQADESAMENPNLLEGDIKAVGGIIITPKNVQQVMNTNNVKGVHRNAVRDKIDYASETFEHICSLWPTTKVPYKLSTQYSSYSRSRIAAAMDEYGKNTCIQFVPRTIERDYLSIAPIDGCYSLVGRSGGAQELSLDSGCIAKGIIMHELMHAVGFFHEQSRTDRDQYVDIVWDNIASGLKDQFQKYSSRTLKTMNMPYDYNSIMHYSSRAFSKNGQATIKPKVSNAKIGQRRGFSDTDKTELNKLYQCRGQGGLVTFLPLDGSVNEALATPAPSIINGVMCKDSRPDCGFLKNYNDYCRTQTSWMQLHCTKSCNLCNGQQSTDSNRRPPRTPLPLVNSTERPICNDRFTFCKDWATSGYCKGPVYSKFMNNYCKKSCNIC